MVTVTSTVPAATPAGLRTSTKVVERLTKSVAGVVPKSIAVGPVRSAPGDHDNSAAR